MYKGFTAVSFPLIRGRSLMMKCGKPIKKINWTMEKAQILNEMWEKTEKTIVWMDETRDQLCIDINVVSKIHK